jgi:hypothetical protein
MITYLEDNNSYQSWDGSSWVGLVPQSSNVIINGGFDIWQRGTTFTYVGGAINYTADRWQGWATASGTNLNISRQLSGLTNHQHAARFQRVSGNTSTALLVLGHSVETANSIPLAGRSVTLSFFARAGANFSPTSANLAVAVTSGTGTDQNFTAFTGSTTVASQTVSLTSSFVRYSMTGTMASNATQLGLTFTMTPTGTAGANDWFEITGVQLEAGPVATPFRRNANSLAGELAACQRYYERVGTGTVGRIGGANIVEYGIRFIEKRATPTFSLARTNTQFYDPAVGTRTATGATISLTSASVNGAVVSVLGYSGLTTGNFALIINANDIEVSSEL